MSSARTFFRHCPNCGRRFEVRLVSKSMISSEEGIAPDGDALMQEADSTVAPKAVAPVWLRDDAPTVVDVQDFQYTYKCGHCGHVWTEVHQVSQDVRTP